MQKQISPLSTNINSKSDKKSSNLNARTKIDKIIIDPNTIYHKDYIITKHEVKLSEINKEKINWSEIASLKII
jgi:hypothetical protein